MRKILLPLLLLPVSLLAFQSEERQILQQNLDTYYQDEIPLKVHLTFNQDAYLPGDTLFFKAYIRLARDGKSLRMGTVLHVSLIHADGKEVVRQMVRIDGESSNQILVSPSLPAGVYTVVAYTEWMKRQGEDSYFRKHIRIGHPKSVGTPLAFYPEGGNLIAGVTQKVIVSGTPGTHGVVANSAGTTIASFELDQYGLGEFSVLSQSGERLTAKLDGFMGTYNLPDVKPDGFVVTLSEMPTGSARFALQVPTNSSLRDRQVTALAILNGKIFFSANFRMGDRNLLSIDVPVSASAGGIAALVLWSADEIVAQRMFLIPDPQAPAISVELSSTQLTTREKVTLAIKLRDGRGNPLSSPKLLISAYDKGASSTTDDRMVPGNPKHEGASRGAWALAPEFLSGAADKNILDRFLITQRWITSAMLQSRGSRKRAYFSSSIHLTGRAVSTAGREVPDSTQITFVLQRGINTYKAYVKDAKFDAVLFTDFFGKDEAFYRVEYKGERRDDVRLVIDPLPEEPKSELRSEGQSSFYSNRISINESFRYYLNTSPIKPPEPNSMFEEEVFGADVEVVLSDYILFPTMEETLREIVPFVQHRRVKDKSVVRVFIDETDEFGIGSPLYVIDGIITDDTDFFMRMKPSDISSIKVINDPDKLTTFGDLGKGGIILVETKVPGFSQTIPKPETTFSLTGLSEPLTFTNIAGHKSSTARVPDLRTALYWEPFLELDENGNATVAIWASDIKGNFVVKAEGFTADGKAFYLEKEFVVNFAPSSN